MIFSLLHSFKRNCNSFALALTLILASVSANSQTWTAVASGGGATGDRCNATCMDAAGNVYVTGTINSGTAVFGGTSLTSAGAFDGVVIKYNSSGALQWALRLGGTTNDHGMGIVTNGSSVYVTGTFSTSMTVGVSPTAYTSAGGQDGYVLKLDAASGATTWVRTMGGSSTDSPQAICTDPSGNVYVTGSFFSVPATFGGSSVSPTGGTGSDLFVTKIDPSGTFLWAKNGGGTGNDNGVGSGICYSPSLNEVVVVGGATGGGMLTYGGVSFPASAGTGNDIVLLELDAATGTFVSGTAAGGGGSSNEDGLAACYDAATGDVFFCGYYNSPSFTLGSTTLNNSTGAGGVDDMFYSRYNPSTNTFTWAKSAGGSGIGSDRARGICSNSSGGIIIGGVVAAGTCTFPSASSVQVTNVRSNGGDPLLLNVNASNGLAVWARIGAADPATATDNPINAVTANSSGDIWGAGLATTNLTFSPLAALTTNANSTDLFVVKMIAPPLTATQSQVNLTCNGVCTGSGTVVASGGTAPYTYSWSPAGGSGATASSLCATNYTVTITDAVSTSITKTFFITQPPAIIINTVSQTNVSCFGGNNGAAQVSATGGTGTLSYNWTPGNPSGDGTTSVTGLTAAVYTVTVTDANSCTATRTLSITQPPALVATSSFSNVSCFGGSNGSASVSVSGGTPTYTYAWAPSGGTAASATSLSAGNYTVTVTDIKGCVLTRSYAVTQPTAPVSGTTVVTNVSCFGGSNGTINLSPNGGSGGYTFNWLPSGPTSEDRTGLTQGTYTVQITDVNGCTGTVNATVTQPATPVSGTTVATNVSCFGGSNGAINLTPNGGSSPYTFNWLPAGPTTEDRTGLVAGTYTVQITDVNGCTSTVNTTVTQPTSPVSGTTVAFNVSCFGGSNGAINLTPNGGTSPYTFNWLPSGPTTEDRTGLVAGTYTVVVTDANGCTGTVNTTVTQPTSPVSGTTVVTNVSCFGGSNGAVNLTPNGGSGGYTFNWLPSGPTTEDRTGLTAGTFSVQITDMNGCTGTVTMTVTQPPTPVSGSTVVTNVSCFGGSNGAINLTPNGGTSPYTFNWLPSGPTTEDRTGLVAGTYTVQITDVNGCTGTVNTTVTQPTSPVSGTTVVTNVSCFGGSNGAVNLTPSGGTPGYTFNWLPSGPTTEDRTGLTAGTFSVQITDANGCTGTVTMTVTQPPTPVSGTTVVTNVSCFGGSNGTINLTPSGGTGPYTFNWGSGITTEDRTGLTAGTYTVIVTDANGCTGTVNTTVTQPPTPVSGSTVVTNVSCFGGSNGAINLTPLGGTPGYTFNWGSGITTEDRTGLTAGTYTVIITDVNGCTGTVNTTVTQSPAITASVTSQTNISCNGGSDGSATISATGGTPSYTYSWSPTGGTAAAATTLSAGTYTCTITDANGCSITKTVTITEPSAITATSSSTPATCGNNNGTATAAASGGTPSYTYSWAPSGGTGATASSLLAGTYTCTVTDANGCSSSTTVAVNSTGGITASITSSSNVSCNGADDGSATAAPTGGSSPFMYAWAPSGGTAATAASLAPGTYTCTVTDNNGCSATATATIAEPSAIAATVTSQTNISCNGGNDGSATVSATGGTPSYAYSWSPSGGTAAAATGLSAGSYTCTITDANGCSITKTVTLTQPPAITAAVTSQTNISCNGGNDGSATISATGGTPSYTYSWSPAGGTATTATGLSAGTYTCTITDANGCSTTKTVSITEPSAITAASSSTPAACGSGNGTATATAGGGTPSYTYSWAPSGGTAATATGLSAGTYTCTITDANGCSSTTTAVVNSSAGVSASISSTTNVSCNGADNGSATAAPSGGTSPFTFAWSPSGGTAATASSLAPGTYTCTITDDNGCSATASTTITEPTAITVTTSQANISCNGGSNGSATVSATGGTPSYTYSWAPSGGTSATAGSLPAGSYTCTITDGNGCSSINTFSITEPSAIAATTSQSNISCFGGSNGTASVTVSGGTPSYTYAWAPSGGTAATASSLSPGTYTCTITDANGCTATRTFSITQPSAPLSLSSTMTQSTCMDNDGAINLTVAGGTPAYTYLWSNGATTEDVSGLSQGSYTVTVTDAGGCTAQRITAVTRICTVPNTQLSATQCGATLADMTGSFVAVPVTGAQDYEWEFTNAALGYSTITRRGTSSQLIPRTSIPGLQYGTTYNVRIRVKVAGVWGAFSTMCTITISPALPLTQMVSSQCGQTIADLNGTFNCNPVTSAQDYEWEFTNASLGYSFTITRGSSSQFITKTNIVGLQFNQSYNVRIRAKIDGNWANFGPVCVITMGPSPATQLIASQCNQSMNLSGNLTCTAVTGATDYEWNISNASGYNVTRMRGANSTSITKNSFPGLANGVTYTVRVNAKVGGAVGTNTNTCTITINTALMPTLSFINRGFEDGSATEMNDSRLVVFPNPSGSTGFSLALEGLTEGPHQVTVQIYDVHGKMVWSKALSNIEGDQLINLNSDGSFTGGIYFVNAQVDDISLNQKIIIQ